MSLFVTFAIVNIKLLAMPETALAIQPTALMPSEPSKDTLLETFLQSRDVKPSSRALYRRTLRQFFQWMDGKGYMMSGMSLPQVLEYKADLLASGKSSLTIGSYLNSVRLFYEWTEGHKLYPNVAKGVKPPKRLRQHRKMPLNPTQARALVAYCDTLPPRDSALVNLLLRTGLRTIEAAKADIRDITTKSEARGEHRVLLVHGKGRDEKDGFVVLTDKAYGYLERYLAARGPAMPSSPLFVSSSNNSSGERMTTRSISSIAKEALKAIGLDDKRYTAHSLRHTGATNILRETGDLEKTRLFCRHSNPATTLLYVSTIDEERRLQSSGEAVLDNLY